MMLKFLVSCTLINFCVQCCSSPPAPIDTAPTLSPYDKELANIEQDVEDISISKLPGALKKKLARERVRHNEELVSERAYHKQELVSERAYHKQELDELNSKLTSAEKDKLLYRNLSLDATCGRFIRHGLEVFLSFQKGNSDVKQLSKEAREIMQSLKTFLNERTNKLFSVATQLNSLYRKYAFIIAAPQSNEAKAWTGQVAAAYNTLNRISLITIPQYEAVSPNITELMSEFRTASSETEAVEIFKKQCGKCYWSKIVTYLFGDNTEIGRLALMMPVAERIKLTVEQPDWGKLKEPEQKYVNSLLVNGVHMVTGTSRYMDCVEVFYFGSTLRLKYPRSELNKRWPHEDYETQVQLFCDIYAALYDVISQSDIHAPPKFPGVNCTMDPTNMKRYFKSINLPDYYMDEFVFVTKLAVSSLN